MTFSGGQILFCKPSVHVERHRGPTPLMEGCEVVIVINMGVSLWLRKMVPLQSNFHKRFPPLPMCPF